jgi:hypothetical protein
VYVSIKDKLVSSILEELGDLMMGKPSHVTRDLEIGLVKVHACKFEEAISIDHIDSTLVLHLPLGVKGYA